MITPSPAYQWGGSGVVAFFVATAAIMLVRVNIHPRVAHRLVFAVLRRPSGLSRLYSAPPHPRRNAVYGRVHFARVLSVCVLYAARPAHVASSKKGQIGMAAIIVVIDLALHKFQQFSTLFYAGFAYFTLRGIYLFWQTRQQINWRNAIQTHFRLP